MNKLLTALTLGLGLSLIVLLGLSAGLTPVVRARDNENEAQVTSASRIPQPQAGFGSIRVAITGTDTSGCGSVALPCRTVQFAVDEANPGEEILVAAGTYTGVQIRNGLTQTVYISKPLTIRGGYTTADGFAISNPTANPTTLDAQLGGRVFLITDTVSATIENLTVTRGIISGNGLCTDITANCGGGILATGSLTLSNVIVISNTAGRDGGGVAVMLTVTLTGVRFEDNMAGFDGGGLVAFGPADINTTTFISNTSILAGGGAQTADTATIVSSRFESNKSVFNVGGGLRAGGGSVILSDTTFISNTTGASGLIGHGGGLYAFGISIQAINSRFENNRCMAADCDGGGLYMNTSFNNPITLTLTNTSIISNSAVRNGGGVYVNGLAALDGGYFERNQAGGSSLSFSDGGGGLYAQTVTLNDTRFINNTSLKDGGGVWAGATAFLTGGYFEGNISGRHGGGVAARAYASPLILTATEFISNTAQTNGGGLWVEFNEAAINGGRFERNRANGPENDGGFHQTQNGGGGAWVGGTLTVTDTEFINNTAQTNGGGAHVRGATVLNGGLFDQNHSFGDFSFTSYGGGGLYALGSLTFTGAMFTNNQGFQGGGVWSNGLVVATNGLFENNYSRSIGGGLVANSILTLTGTRFISNTAEVGGGGVIVGDGFGGTDSASLSNVLFQTNRTISTTIGGGGAMFASGILTITGSQFISNSTPGSGGAVYTFDSVTLIDTLFQDNISGSSGGAVAGSFLPFVLINTQILSNTATERGGGISSNGKIHLTDGLFQNNRSTANEGGGLYTSGSVILTRTQFISNSAQLNGGGALANSGVIATDGHFERNVSLNGNGGGISAPSGEFILDNTTVISNSAAVDGGGLYTTFRATLIGGRIEANIAQANGGGLLVGNRLTLTATRFIANRAQNGGGVYRYGRSSSRVVNVLLARNKATTNGDGFYIDLNNTTRASDLIHTTIANPTQVNGSAIYVVTGTVNITNSIIAGHTTNLHVEPDAVINENNNLYPDGLNTAGAGTINSGGNSLLSGNPAFLNPAGDDYHLTAASAAIDAATDAGVTTDFEDDLRPGGNGIDIGYDETDFAVDLAITKMVKPDINVTYRDEVTYTIVVSNNGELDAIDTLFTDTLPVSTIFRRWVEQPAGADFSPTPPGEIRWNGTVTANQAITFSFVVSHAGAYGDVVINTVQYSHFYSSGSADATFMVERSPTYLPLIMKNVIFAPDLIVANLIANSEAVTVVIKNDGTASVIDAFWVDVYIDPDSPPTAANQPWPFLSSQGLAWGIVGTNGLPLEPGETLTLTVGDMFYKGPPTSTVTFPLQSGIDIYAQVDSVDLSNPAGFGAVLETHEINGGSYNNISPPLMITTVGGEAAPSLPKNQATQPAFTGNLPPRQ